MKRKVFITGIDGMIGQNLKFFYESKGFDVKGYTRSDWETGKLFNLSLKNYLVYSIKPDIIINCGASIYDKETMFSSNVEMTYNLLEFCKETSNIKMIQIGSSSEYGQCDHATSEDFDPIKVYDSYSATKGCATLLSQAYAKDFDVDVKIVRPYSVYGGIGDKSHKFIPNLIKRFLDSKEETMTVYQGQHDWIYIDDFVNIIDKVVSVEGNFGDIINAGTGKQTSNFEVFEVFCEVFEKIPENVKLIESSLRNQDTEVWCADISKLRDKYGYEIKYSLREGIKKLKGT